MSVSLHCPVLSKGESPPQYYDHLRLDRPMVLKLGGAEALRAGGVGGLKGEK